MSKSYCSRLRRQEPMSFLVATGPPALGPQRSLLPVVAGIRNLREKGRVVVSVEAPEGGHLLCWWT